MARYLSLYRRRPNLVDVNLQSGPGSLVVTTPESRTNAVSYDFQVAANFDSAYTTFQNVPVAGYGSPTSNLPGHNIAFDGEQFSRQRLPYLTRFKFAPSDYMTGGLVNTVFTATGVSDLTPLWIRTVQHNADGTTNNPDSGMLILPYSSQPNRTIMLAGAAPNVGSLASSLEIQLPMQVNNIQLQNNGGAILFVAFEPTGPEFSIDPLASDFVNMYETYPASSQLFVRGNSASVPFNLISALRNNPL